MKKKRQLIKVAGESNGILGEPTNGDNRSPQIFNKVSSTLNSDNMLCQSP